MQAIIAFESINYKPVTGPGYPEWSETLGWLTVTFIMMWIPVYYIGAYCYKGGFKVSSYLLHVCLEPYKLAQSQLLLRRLMLHTGGCQISRSSFVIGRLIIRLLIV